MGDFVFDEALTAISMQYIDQVELDAVHADISHADISDPPLSSTPSRCILELPDA